MSCITELNTVIGYRPNSSELGFPNWLLLPVLSLFSLRFSTIVASEIGTSGARDQPLIKRPVLLVRLKLWSSPLVQTWTLPDMGCSTFVLMCPPALVHVGLPRTERKKNDPPPPKALAFLIANSPCLTVTKDRLVLTEDKHALPSSAAQSDSKSTEKRGWWWWGMSWGGGAIAEENDSKGKGWALHALEVTNSLENVTWKM